MNRRDFLKGTAAASVLGAGCAGWQGRATSVTRRNRPGDPGWPSAAEWTRLEQQVQGRLVAVHSPVAAAQAAPQGKVAEELFRKLKNPYYIGDEAGLTQTSGWVDGWTSAPSVFAVAAARTEDVVAAVNFAREHNLRLVVKGGGHSYKGTSNAADSLLVWTRRMHEIVLHEAFVAEGCAGKQAPQKAVTMGAGTIWAQAYRAVTVEGGRYVQGGGCTTVGVAGLIQSGGFGSFSKNFGTAAAGLLEAEVVTADGMVRVANAVRNPDLFWGLKGGGGGSLGVVTKVTLRTRELPNYFGGVFGTIQARSDSAYRRLIARVMAFYGEALFNPHWGEQIRFDPRNKLEISMVFQGLEREQAMEVWRPFIEWVAASPEDFTVEREIGAVAVAARDFWNPEVMRTLLPGVIVFDDRPNVPLGNFLWEGDHGQVGWVIHGYQSVWLPASLLEEDRQQSLVEGLFASSRHWSVALHFNKGLAGARPEEIAAARDTATNPAVLDAFALAIVATGEGPAFPGFPGHEPNVEKAREHARAIEAAAVELRKRAGNGGAYVSESDFFERSWQESFWGSNHAKLARVKRTYDPEGLFYVHHGVGSEVWSADGFTRKAGAP